MTKVRVEVTAEDIAKGERDKCSRCPVALAVGRAVPGAAVAVSNISLFVKMEGELVDRHCWLPVAARLFVSDFDDGLPVEPFAFDLDIPE